MFDTEQEMSSRFEKYLKANFGNAYLKECQGLFGVPDYVFYAKNRDEISIVSFELKLKNWKRAAKQAFRYRSFSNISYVVLPAKSVDAALNNIEFFERYNIGLAKFGEDNLLNILYKPKVGKPYSEMLAQKIVSSIGKSRKKSKNFEMLVGA